MKADPCNTFDNPKMLEKSFQEMPNSDNITRWLKKLFIMMSKGHDSIDSFIFENDKNLIEWTGLEIEEKNIIIQELLENGLPVAAEPKSEWTNLKDKLSSKIKEKGVTKSKFDSKNVQLVEWFV